MRKSFAQFCAFITGFSIVELQGTGLLDIYCDLVHQVLGKKLSTQFDELVKTLVVAETDAAREQKFQLLFVASDVFWPVTAGLISLWYMGVWTVLPGDWYQKQGLPIPLPGAAGSTSVPCELAYVEQLSYRAASAHPPGAKPTGYGSWSIPPVI